MLERPALVLCPWAAPTLPPGREAGAPTGPRRTVLDPGGPALGFVARVPSGPRWLRWLTSPHLEVYETEDASLLCTVSGAAWGRRGRDVRDSEGRLVGTVRQLLLFDASGRLLAQGRPATDGATRFVSPAGLDLGVFAPCENGTLLTLMPVIDGDPFARMLLLGATLVLT
ncbi:MAG TPA: hypothetical protein VEL76_20240 [Gemmataceae bacterium]|nr:hypothetical protein [Gemmataceae bacterium]